MSADPAAPSVAVAAENHCGVHVAPATIDARLLDGNDPEGDDAKLVPIAMSVPRFGELDSTTLTWDPLEDTVWLTKHVGTVGKDDLGSQVGAAFDAYYGHESYTWIGTPPSTVYAQAIAGSQQVDSTSFWLNAAVSIDAVSAAAPFPAATTLYSGANGTQAGPELLWDDLGNWKVVTGKIAGNVIVGEQVQLEVSYLGPNSAPIQAPGQTNTALNWNVPGSPINNYADVTQVAAISPYFGTAANQDIPNQTSFYWVDAGSPNRTIQRTVSVSGRYLGIPITNLSTTLTLVSPFWKTFSPQTTPPDVFTSVAGVRRVSMGSYTPGSNAINVTYGITFPTILRMPTGFTVTANSQWKYVQKVSLSGTFADAQGIQFQYPPQFIESKQSP